MSLALISNPSKLLNGIKSRLNACFIQVPYEFLRKDDLFTGWDDDGGFVRILNVGTIADYSPNDIIYIVTDNGQIDASGSIDSILGNDVTTDIPFPVGGTSSAGYANFITARYDYKVHCYIVSESGVRLNASVFSYSTELNGRLFLDLSAVVRIFSLSSPYKFVHSLEYTEFWGGIDQSIPVIDEQILSLFAKRGLLTYGGANMWNRLLATEDPYQGFLVSFGSGQGKFYRGWKKEIAYAVDLDILSRVAGDIDIVEEALDINGVVISTNTSVGSKITGINTIVLTEFSNASYHRVYLESGGTRISQIYDLIYEDECSKPIVVEWQNVQGANEVWMFSNNHVFTEDVTEHIQGESSIDQDIEYETGTQVQIILRIIQRAILNADNLTLNQLKTLGTIKWSSELWVWLNKDGSKKVRVIINKNFDTVYSTRPERQSIGISISFPENYDLFTTLEYTF